MPIFKKIKTQVPVEKGWLSSQKPEAKLSIDLYETDDNLVIQSTIAGVKADDLNIAVENGMLSIRGSRKKPEESSSLQKKYLYQECYWGAFSKKIILPEEVDPSQVQATIKEGVLTISIPKVKRKEKRKIEIIEKD